MTFYIIIENISNVYYKNMMKKTNIIIKYNIYNNNNHAVFAFLN